MHYHVGILLYRRIFPSKMYLKHQTLCDFLHWLTLVFISFIKMVFGQLVQEGT